MTAKDNIEKKEIVDNFIADTLRRRHDAAHCFPPQPESCELTVSCRRSDYSASTIARAVEDCDAHLLNLNVTDQSRGADDPSSVLVDIRVNMRNAESVARSLERYGYDVVAIVGDGAATVDTTLRDRLDLLLLNLEI